MSATAILILLNAVANGCGTLAPPPPSVAAEVVEAVLLFEPEDTQSPAVTLAGAIGETEVEGETADDPAADQCPVVRALVIA